MLKQPTLKSFEFFKAMMIIFGKIRLTLDYHDLSFGYVFPTPRNAGGSNY